MEVLIVGGGAVGMACAVRAQAAGARVTVLDAPDRPPPPSWGNAGHIAVEQVVPLASWAMIASAPRRLAAWNGGLSLPLAQIGRWLPFSLRLLRATRNLAAGTTAMKALLAEAMPAWQRYTANLGTPNLLRQNGHLIAWMDTAAAVRGRAHWLNADSGSARFGDASTPQHHALAGVTDRRLAGAVYCNGSGQIGDLSALADASRAALDAKGGKIHRGQAVGLIRHNSRAGAVLADGSHIFADQLVITGGIGAAPLMASLGHPVPMIAERGYHLQYDPGQWPTDLPPVVFEEQALIVTRFAHTVRVCSDLEFSAAAAPADPRKWARIARSVEVLGLKLGQPTGRWMGARPTLPDYLPAIGRLDHQVIYAFGHQHLGLTLAAITGEIVSTLLAGTTPPLNITPFDIARFA